MPWRMPATITLLILALSTIIQEVRIRAGRRISRLLCEAFLGTTEGETSRISDLVDNGWLRLTGGPDLLDHCSAICRYGIEPRTSHSGRFHTGCRCSAARSQGNGRVSGSPRRSCLQLYSEPADSKGGSGGGRFSGWSSSPPGKA